MREWAFCERLDSLVEVATEGLSDAAKRRRRFEELTDRLLPEIQFYTRLAVGLTTYEEARIKAVEIETMLAANPLMSHCIGQNPSVSSPVAPYLDR